MGLLFPLASAEDGVTVNGSPQTSTGTDVDERRIKLNQSLQDEDYSNGLVQSLHDAARVFELAIKEQGSLSKLSWFSTAWLGVDRNAWVKTLSYQVCHFSFFVLIFTCLIDVCFCTTSSQGVVFIRLLYQKILTFIYF